MCAEIAPGARAGLRGHGWTSPGPCAVTKAQGKSCTVNANSHKFRVREFAYSLKFICSLKIDTRSTFQSLADVHEVVKGLSHQHADALWGGGGRPGQCCAGRSGLGAIQGPGSPALAPVRGAASGRYTRLLLIFLFCKTRQIESTRKN